ncbi:MAG: hypothetical protein E7580_02845 [Ruminococcaceae bacterium]|nr:hypothetical protein [Oscillospiraceae bacterium]
MFQAGFSRLDVTPPFGSPLSGYSKKREADHIIDPLELNCVAFFDGENTAVLITADFLSVRESAATFIRNKIAERCGIPADHIFMQALHQHTSIRLGTPATGGGKHFRDEAYFDVLWRKYCDLAQSAIADLKDATLSYAVGETAEQISFVRRYRMKDGSVRTNPGRGKGYLVSHPLDEPDNSVRLLRFKREGADDIAIINFACHPDVIGYIDPTGFSADWPGYARRHTEKALPEVKAILVNGFQGDSNHINPFRPKEEEQKRRGVPHSSFMGKTIADAVISLWEKTEPMETGKIWGKIEMLYVPTNREGFERIEECQQILCEIARGEREPFPNSTVSSEIRRIASFPGELLFQKVPVSALCIGGAGFVGFGGEPFTKYIQMVREKGGEIFMMTACQCNGSQGYLPTKEAFEQGGYEAHSSRFDPVLEEKLTESTEKLLNEYKLH